MVILAIVKDAPISAPAPARRKRGAKSVAHVVTDERTSGFNVLRMVLSYGNQYKKGQLHSRQSRCGLPSASWLPARVYVYSEPSC